MTKQTTAISAPPAQAQFNVDYWAAFWADPDPSRVGRAVSADVTGHWPGDAKAVHGPQEYRQRIVDVLERVPDLRLEVVEHAQNEAVIFIRWRARGTGADGPFEMYGIDRIRLEDGYVKDNHICYDSAEFEALVGSP